jgi:tRNA nucleotidyltransferase (CCA-adding enzyme)
MRALPDPGPHLPAPARDLAEAVRARGGRALVVGGWVRDVLLGHVSKDIDVEVYGIPESELRVLLSAFGRVEPIGQSFPVYKIGDIDVALPRRESKSGRGHKAFHVEGDPHLSLEEAARRRDFTINAIAWDPLTGAWEDPFNGRDDLECRLLKVVDPRTFGDDSLRVLRAIQFTARFELSVPPETRAICAAIPLDDLPAERIWGEIDKLLLRAERPSIGFTLALDLDVIRRLLPEMQALVGCQQEHEWHPEGDVWVHTLMVIDRARQEIGPLDRPQQIAIMLAAVCHDLGKPLTTAFIDGRIRSPGHEQAGVPPAEAILDRLNIQTIDGYDVRKQVIGLVAYHLSPGMWFKVRDAVGDGAFRRLSQKVDLELLARLARADCTGRTGPFDCSAMDWFLERARALGVEHRPPPRIVLGRHLIDLGLAPGPAMGRLLNRLYERQLDGDIDSLEKGLELAREILQSEEARPG